MALFKLRKKVDEPVAAAAAPAESIEVVRRRARHRLIGAVVLVLAGVIGFPLLFDTQPRPVAVDIPIVIPDRNKVAPLASPLPQASVGKVEAASAPAVESRPVESAPAESRVAAVEPAPAPAPRPVAAESKAAASEPRPAEAKPAAPERPTPPPAVAKADTDRQAKGDEAAKARALLEGRAVAAVGGGRFVVQVGAFAEDAKARQAQLKLDRAGLRNYRQVAETEEGKRIRVRAGPFASRAEADQAAEKIKGLDLPARVLTL